MRHVRARLKENRFDESSRDAKRRRSDSTRLRHDKRAWYWLRSKGLRHTGFHSDSVLAFSRVSTRLAVAALRMREEKWLFSTKNIEMISLEPIEVRGFTMSAFGWPSVATRHRWEGRNGQRTLSLIDKIGSRRKIWTVWNLSRNLNGMLIHVFTVS